MLDEAYWSFYTEMKLIIKPPLATAAIWNQRKLGSKQAYRVVHQPVSRGFAVFADAWL